MKVKNPKPGHVRVREIPLAKIRPHPMNDKLYRPVDPNDPDVQALAAAVRKNGVDPLRVTSDLVVLSGHRRRVAARLAGLMTVPCMVEDFDSDDPRCLPLLAECNRQRVKTAAEALREEVILSDPEEAHRVLTEHRRRASALQGDSLVLEGMKRRNAISPAKQPFLDAVLDVLRQYRDFLPLTDRQIHYALLNKPPLRHASKPDSRYANTVASYKDLCDLVTRARLAGDIPFGHIHDPTRPSVSWNMFRDAAPFIRKEMGDFLKDYYRDLLQSQPNHIEIVGEKNTVEGVIRPVAGNFCMPYSIGRGYSSLPPRWAMAQRFRSSGKEKLVLLMLTDFDPEGEDIAHSFARSMRDDFGITRLEPRKICLTADQVDEMELPPQMKAKAGSSRRKKFVRRHGDDVYELEAVPPQRLQEILTEAIDGVLDVRAFNAEVEREKQDAAYLDGVRNRVADVLKALDGLGTDAS